MSVEASSVEQLLKHADLDKTQIINDLLSVIGELEFKIQTREDSILALTALHKDQITRQREAHDVELQKHMDKHAETLSLIQSMDEIAAENTIMVKCRKCDCMYELPCDLSEFNPEYSYCGKGGPSPCTP